MWQKISIILSIYACILSCFHFRSEDVPSVPTASQAKTHVRPARALRGAVRDRAQVEAELLAQLAQGGPVPRLVAIINGLAVVGGADTVTTLRPIVLTNRRWGLANAAISALGKIDRDDAIELLWEVSEKRREYADDALNALAMTGSMNAHDRIMELALVPGSRQLDAINALGVWATDAALDVMESLLKGADADR